MENTLFAGRQRIAARAFYLAQRTRMQGIDRTERLALSPLTQRAGASGRAVIFRYGAVVLFGLDDAEEAAFLRTLGPMLQAPHAERESDEVQVIVEAGGEDRIEPTGIVVSEFTVERLQLVADVLARRSRVLFLDAAAAAELAAPVAEILADELQRPVDTTAFSALAAQYRQLP